MQVKKMALALMFLSGAAFAGPNPSHDVLQQMSSSEQSRILTGLVSSAGNHCSAAETQFLYIDKHDSSAYYRVECASGPNFMLRIRNDRGGSNSSTNCALLAAVNINCFDDFSEYRR